MFLALYNTIEACDHVMGFINCVCTEVSTGHSTRLKGQSYPIKLCSDPSVAFVGGFPLSLRFSHSLGIVGEPLSVCSSCYHRNRAQWRNDVSTRCMSEAQRVHILATCVDFLPLLGSPRVASQDQPWLSALHIAAASTISTSMSTTANAAAVVTASADTTDTTSTSTLLPDTPLSPKSDVRRALLRLKTDSPIKTGGSAYVKIPLPRSAGIVKKDQLRVRLKVLQSVENMMTGSPGGSTRLVGTPSAPTPPAAQLLEQLLSTKGAIVLG